MVTGLELTSHPKMNLETLCHVVLHSFGKNCSDSSLKLIRSSNVRFSLHHQSSTSRKVDSNTQFTNKNDWTYNDVILKIQPEMKLIAVSKINNFGTGVRPESLSTKAIVAMGPQVGDIAELF